MSKEFEEIQSDFIDRLKKLDAAFTLSEEQLGQFKTYYENLVEWNNVMNLTTITETEDVYIKHFLDSLSIVKAISPDYLKSLRIIDVGTGAGFPGLPIAIAFPKTKVILMDSLNKRIHFLEDTINKIGVKNVTCIHSRAEDLARNQEYREQFDLAVSRAVANLSTLSEYCLPFIKKDGCFAAMKSEKADEELTASGKAIDLLGGKVESRVEFFLPETDYKRIIFVIRKKQNTPGKYPRKAGLPAKEPLH